MVLGVLEEEGGGGSVSSRHPHILQLRERNRGQARLLLAARRRLRDQSNLTSRIHGERDTNLRNISGQLLLLESNLRKRQDELATLLREKELTVLNQQRLIVALATALSQLTGHKEILQLLAASSTTVPSPTGSKIDEQTTRDLGKILQDIVDKASLTQNECNKNNVNNASSNNSTSVYCLNCNKNMNSKQNDSLSRVSDKKCENGDTKVDNSQNNGHSINSKDSDENKENVSRNNNINRTKNNFKEDFNNTSNNNSKSKTERSTIITNEDQTIVLTDDTDITSSTDTLEGKTDTDSVTDTDSAIMLEDTCSDSLVVFPFMRDGVKVIRSVSDALECSSRLLPLSVAKSNGDDDGSNMLDAFSDSCDVTPVNSPSISPRLDTNKKYQLQRQNHIKETHKITSFDAISAADTEADDSSFSSPFSSSAEDSDSSPTTTLNKARSSSLQSITDSKPEDVDNGETLSNENNNKAPLCRSQSDNSQNITPMIDPLIHHREDSIDEEANTTENSNANTNKIEPNCNDVNQNPECDLVSLTSDLPFDICTDTSSVDGEFLSSEPSDSDATLSDSETDFELMLEYVYDTDGNILEDHHLAAVALANAPGCNTEDRRLLLGSYEKLSDIDSVRPPRTNYKKKPDEQIQVKYNRVMSNHRSVTKVKDVKYRRINKAKSRSLEELRGKLRKHDGKPLISVSIGHSYA